LRHLDCSRYAPDIYPILKCPFVSRGVPGLRSI
jgi:hypothetical protein